MKGFKRIIEGVKRNLLNRGIGREGEQFARHQRETARTRRRWKCRLSKVFLAGNLSRRCALSLTLHTQVQSNCVGRFQSSKAFSNSRPEVVKPEKKTKLDAWLITGFTDGDGNFGITHSVYHGNTGVFFRFGLRFCVTALKNMENEKFLNDLRHHFNTEVCLLLEKNNLYLRVNSLKELKNIKNHFEKYPLQTTKSDYFFYWCQVFDILTSKKTLSSSLSLEDTFRILFWKSQSKNKLNPKLQKNYDVIRKTLETAGKLTLLETELKSLLAQKPKVTTRSLTKPLEPLEPFWISGFVQADGSFFFTFRKDTSGKSTKYLQSRFVIYQHCRDQEVLSRIKEVLGCGTLEIVSTRRQAAQLRVSSLNDFTKYIIPFFETYPLCGSKQFDFENWAEVQKLRINNKHLTDAGINNIKELFLKMNLRQK